MGNTRGFLSGNVWLVLLVGASLFLRLYGISFGLPHLYHQDEQVTVPIALKFATGDLNPHYSWHPHLLHYTLFGLYGTTFVIGFLFHVFPSVSEFQKCFFQDPSLFYLVGRAFCAFIGTASIPAMVAYGMRLCDRRVGILAGLFLATSFLHVRTSHYVRHDVPVVFMILLSSLAIFGFFEKGGRARAFWAGIVVGLSTVTNWNGALLLVPMTVAIFLRREKIPASLIYLLLSVGGCLLGAFLGSPFVFLEAREGLMKGFLSKFPTLGTFRSMQSTFLADPTTTGWNRYLFYYLTVGMGWPLEILGIAGAFFLLSRHAKKDLLFLSFPVLYFLFIGSIHKVTRAEYILPVLPYLYLSGAALLVWIADRLKEGWRFCFLCTAGIFLVLLPLEASLRHDYLITQKDTRTLTKEWVESHAPEGSRIAMERYLYLRAWTPPLLETEEENLKLLNAIQKNDPSKGKMRRAISSIQKSAPRYTLVEITTAQHLSEEFESNYSVDALLKKRVRYVILSSFVTEFQKRLSDPSVEHFYRDLRERGRLIQRFSAFREGIADERQDHSPHTPFDRLRQMERPGPVIEIYALGNRP